MSLRQKGVENKENERMWNMDVKARDDTRSGWIDGSEETDHGLSATKSATLWIVIF